MEFLGAKQSSLSAASEWGRKRDEIFPCSVGAEDLINLVLKPLNQTCSVWKLLNYVFIFADILLVIYYL